MTTTQSTTLLADFVNGSPNANRAKNCGRGAHSVDRVIPPTGWNSWSIYLASTLI